MPDKNKLMRLEDLQVIKGAERERFARIDAAFLEHRFFLKACRIKILMLVDEGIFYAIPILA